MATVEIPNGDKIIEVSLGERVTFTFKQDAIFHTQDSGSFDPPLALGAIKAGTTAVHKPAPGSENSDVLYCYSLSGSPVATCKSPMTHRRALAGHIIHIGSGGSVVTKLEIAAFEKSFESVAKGARFVDLWPAAKTFINLLLKLKPPIPSKFRVILQILLMTGEEAFLRVKKHA